MATIPLKAAKVDTPRNVANNLATGRGATKLKAFKLSSFSKNFFIDKKAALPPVKPEAKVTRLLIVFLFFK